MSKSVVNEFQPSVTEWFALIGENKEAEEFRVEDNHKVDRLEYLFQTIGLPYERPERLDATELTNKSDRFKKILLERGDELCAIRLVPKKEGLAKIRNRGLTIRQCYEGWYLKQNIDPENYTAFICPHAEYTPWSMIFVVKPDLIFGEIVQGLHCQLTQGTTTHQTVNFQSDFKTWQWSSKNPGVKKILEKTLKLITVSSAKIRGIVSDDLKVKFTYNVLCGYFEAVVWPDNQVYFIDYNRLLPNYIPSPSKLVNAKNSIVSGKVAYTGKTEGRVVVVEADDIKNINFEQGDILVCHNTDVRFLPLMRKAGGIITDLGGLLSHASIIARELRIPCLIDTKKATTLLKTGDRIVLDCDNNCVGLVDR